MTAFERIILENQLVEFCHRYDREDYNVYESDLLKRIEAMSVALGIDPPRKPKKPSDPYEPQQTG